MTRPRLDQQPGAYFYARRMAADDVEQVRRQVQWAHDSLHEAPEMSAEDRARIAGARTAYASVLGMFDALDKDQEPTAPTPPRLRLVTGTDPDDNRTRDR